MDNNKTKKIIAIVLTTVISLIVSVVACIFEIPRDELDSIYADTSYSYTAGADGSMR